MKVMLHGNLVRHPALQVREVQATVKDGRTGEQKMMISRALGDKVGWHMLGARGTWVQQGL
jgi:hypothetical protein